MLPSIGAIAALRRWLYGELVKFCWLLQHFLPPPYLHWPAHALPATTRFSIGTKSKTVEPRQAQHGCLKLPRGSEDHGSGSNQGGAFERSRTDTVEPAPRRGRRFDQRASRSRPFPHTVFLHPQRALPRSSTCTAARWRRANGATTPSTSAARRPCSRCSAAPSEVPLYRIEKNPRLARRQGAYSVVAATGLILKRGHELTRVLAVLGKGVRLAVVCEHRSSLAIPGRPRRHRPLRLSWL